MWGSLVFVLLARSWARRVAGIALVALTITLFLINLRRAAERDTTGAPLSAYNNWSVPMSFNARCWMQPAAALAAGMILLSGCAAAGFDNLPCACPPVVEYSRAEQARVAVEVVALPDGAVINEWLADYAVLREQARACS